MSELPLIQPPPSFCRNLATLQTFTNKIFFSDLHRAFSLWREANSILCIFMQNGRKIRFVTIVAWHIARIPKWPSFNINFIFSYYGSVYIQQFYQYWLSKLSTGCVVKIQVLSRFFDQVRHENRYSDFQNHYLCRKLNESFQF